MIETKKVTDRRTLSFSNMEDLLADVEAMDGATVRATGNWTAAQNISHVAKVITGSLDRIDLQAPFLMRMFGKLMKNRALSKTFSPGYKIPGGFSAFLPDPEVTWDDAVGELRREIERLRGGAKMTIASPFLGEMTHDDWVRLHCRHAELHFSFIHPE